MRATAILPVKRFAAAKSRLAESPAGPARPGLAEAMVGDVLAALGRAERLERVVVVSGEDRAREAAASVGADWIDDPADRGHSEAAVAGIAAAIAAGAECVALLPGDCPLLDPGELDAALAEVSTGTVGVIPDRHGSGTNGLLLAPPNAIVPSFGPGSRERHLRSAREAGVAARVVEIASMGLDLDTPDDLRELTLALEREPERAPATARAIAAIDADEAAR